MPLRPDRTLLERYRVLSTAAPEDGMIRARALDTSTDERIELLVPDRTARLRPGARARFHLAGERVDHDGVLDRIDLGEVDGVPVAARPAGLRAWPDGRWLAPEAAAETLAWLAPAVAAATPALGGELDGRDLVLDRGGIPRVSPSGIVRAESLAALPHHRPPEAWDGAAPSVEAALYGLGVVLYEALTGQRPTTATTRAQLERAQRKPRPVRALRPDLPETVAAQVDALVSPDPATRRALLATLPCPAPPRLPASARAPASAPTPRESPPVAIPRRPAPDAAEDRRLHGWLVIADLSGTTRAARRRLAALAGLPHAGLEAAAKSGAVPVVEGRRNEREARDAMAALAPAGVPLTVALAPDAPVGRYVAALGLGGAGGLGVLGALAMSPLGLGFLLAAALPATALLLGGTVLALRAARDGRRLASLRAAARSIDAAPPPDAARQALSEARRAALQPHVPDAIRADLLAATDDLDDALDASPDAAAIDAVTEAARRLAAAAAVPPTDEASDGLRERLEEAERRAHAAAQTLRGG